MAITTVFTNNRSQAIRLPMELRLAGRMAISSIALSELYHGASSRVGALDWRDSTGAMVKVFVIPGSIWHLWQPKAWTPDQVGGDGFV